MKEESTRPANTVLVPCDELEKMKAELKALREWKETWLPFLQNHFAINEALRTYDGKRE